MGKICPNANNDDKYTLRRRENECRAQFKTLQDFWDHAKQLLIEQGYRCHITGMLMRDTCHNSTAGERMFAPSLDAIDPRKGHVKGNIRWICSFLNCQTNDKYKIEDFEDDRPTQWTKKLFFEMIEYPEEEKMVTFRS